MKPSWYDAPPWANYLAMNQNGDWIWYEHKPVPRFGVWWLSREGRYEIAQEAPRNWSDSLEHILEYKEVNEQRLEAEIQHGCQPQP